MKEGKPPEMLFFLPLLAAMLLVQFTAACPKVDAQL